MSEEQIVDDTTEDPAEELDLEKLTTDELLALARAAESKANVFAQLAQSDPERHSAQAEEANAELQKYADALKEHNYTASGAMIDPTKTVPDKEGTAPTLADATGTYAEDAVVANIGGIGINNSNADPDGALAELKRRAEEGSADYVPRGSSPLMDARTSIAAQREAESTERVPLEREPA